MTTGFLAFLLVLAAAFAPPRAEAAVPVPHDPLVAARAARPDGISGPGRMLAPDEVPTQASPRKTDNSAVKQGLLPPIRPLLDLHIRDTVICLGGDGNYYLTGSTGKDIWNFNDGVELWRSPDLQQWNYLGLVWSVVSDGTWEKEPRDLHGKPTVTVWAPEIRYLKSLNTYVIVLSMAPGGISILKSTTSKPEGPYVNAVPGGKPLRTGGIDPTIFEDDDGKVYFSSGAGGTISLMKDDLSGFAETRSVVLLNPDLNPAHHAKKVVERGMKGFGHEGAVLFKANGKYYHGAVDDYEGRYSSCVAIATNIWGPYDDWHETVPCGGGTDFFQDKDGRWWSAFFGNDGQAPWRELPGIVRVEFDGEGKIHVSTNQPFLENPSATVEVGAVWLGGVQVQDKGDSRIMADTTNAGRQSRNRASIADAGAVGDGATLNTSAIQAAIDHLAAQGGGTLAVPKGVFLTGAIFLKPGVNLYLDKDAVLKCSTDMANFPAQRTRIEGHFEAHFNPALINASGCDGLRIDGEGTLDGAGRPIWDLFWRLRNAAPDRKNFPNLSVPRARLCLIENSKHVVIEGVTFKDSQFWNLHLYKCRDVLVQNARFEVPDDYKQAPSTDGIDVDSCQAVTIKGCYFSVTDDCIALKGSKGPHAMDDKDSPPVEHIRVEDCTFKRGGGVLTCGSEATIVRDVVVENCRVVGPVNVVVLKLRPDTPQHYEDIHFRGITLDSKKGELLHVQPWTQYFDLKGQPAPRSVVHNVTLSNIRGRFGSLGEVRGNPGQTTISDITLEHVDVKLDSETLGVGDVEQLRINDVRVNGKPWKQN